MFLPFNSLRSTKVIDLPAAPINESPELPSHVREAWESVLCMMVCTCREAEAAGSPEQKVCQANRRTPLDADCAVCIHEI